MPRKTTYKTVWEKENQWLEGVKNDSYKANCKLCSTNFNIGNMGLTQVKRHSETKKHVDIVKTLSGETKNHASCLSFILLYRYVDVIVQQCQLLQTEDLSEISDKTSYVFWHKISEMKDIHDQFKYADISKLVMACFCVNHGNAAAERGFSTNKNTLQDRESLNEDTIAALRTVKDGIDTYKDFHNVPINDRLMGLCRNAHAKYLAYLDAQKLEAAIQQKEKTAAEKAARDRVEKKSKAVKIKESDKAIDVELGRINVAEKLLSEGNKSLAKVVNSRGQVDKCELLKVQAILSAATERISESNTKIDDLKKKKSSFQK